MLREVIVFLVAAGLIVPLIHRLKLSPVLGFLAVGMLIGPHGLGQLTDTWPWLSTIVLDDVETVRHIAEFGVVFLLFLIGLELSLDRLMRMRRLVFGLGAAQVIITAVVIGGIAASFGNSPAASAVLGACLALSSTAIVMQLLIERRRLGTPTGQTSFSILLFQDLSVVPILFAAQVMSASGNGDNVWLDFSLAIAKAGLAVCVILLLGRWVVHPLFRFAGATETREMFMAAVLLVVIATSVATSSAGLSLALGAFLAGLLLSESEYRHQIEVDIEPFKGLLLGLFFLSVGMELDLAAVMERPSLIFLSVAGLIILKASLIYVLARAFGSPRSVAIETAILLGPAGEFAFVVLAVALSGQLINGDTVGFILMVAGISMVLTPGLAYVARLVAARFESGDAADGTSLPSDTSNQPTGHVIVAGYGRVGQLLGRLLEDAHIAHLGLDRDAGLVRRYAKSGAAVHYGDASQTRILELAGIEQAAALIVTMDNVRAAEGIVAGVRRIHHDLPILVRARDAEHARRLLAVGATEVVPETIEASFDLAEVTFHALGLNSDTAHRLVADQRRRERAHLHGDLPPDDDILPGAPDRTATGEDTKKD
ncbi:MAG: monovalent cation:proton antiporter-2 (CPA2) family protein [Pseudomonadota bacterium]